MKNQCEPIIPNYTSECNYTGNRINKVAAIPSRDGTIKVFNEEGDFIGLLKEGEGGVYVSRVT